MALTCGARPDILPWFKLEVVDFKVTDPAAADPNAPVHMLYTHQPFKMTLTLKVTGTWKGLFTGPANLWATNFYANALGIDVLGELKWGPAAAALPAPVAADTYEVSYTVGAGIGTQGIYEFGAVTRLPGQAINGHCSEYDVEFADV